MKKLILFLIIGLAFQVQGQQFYTELYGFKLGQFRNVANKELGKPIQYGKFEDGFVYEAYSLKPDTSLHIIFEYAARDTSIIWSIQVSGYDSTTSIDFKDAKLGVNKIQTEKLFGKPSSKEDIGEYGQKWNYDNTNFSVEVNKEGKLSSVKILDNSDELFPNQDLKKLPSFDNIQKTFNTGNNGDILKLLSGDIEIYYKDKTYSFNKSFKNEETTDYSKIISVIREISKDLKTINTKDDEEYEENMRLTLGENSKHVMKFKKRHVIKEIVFKYYGGQYLIYEINAN